MNIQIPRPLRHGLGVGVVESKPPLVASPIFQFFGGLFTCVFLPALVRGQISLPQVPDSTLVNATVGAAVAFILSFYYVRRMGSFPGVRSGSNILFAMSVPFVLTIAAFFALRLGYSRFMFATSYGLSLIWFLAMHMLARRRLKPRLAIIPGGNSISLSELNGVNWEILSDPPKDTGGISAVVADLRKDMSAEWERFVARCTLDGVPVFHSKQIHESLTGKVQIEHLSENQFGSLLPNLAYLKIKQWLDWLLALIALPFLLLVILVVAPLIVIDSGWPVFFVQRRVGYRGRLFNVYKFRTMRSIPREVGASGNKRSAAITRVGDRRITRAGRLLRRYRIDELPQIFNILKGEMSWIGPRPEAQQLAEWYEAELPFYCYRHVVRPGISGWAQVNQGHVAAPVQVLDKLHYDFFYIKYLSPWLDMLVFMRTLRTVFNGFGAK